MVEQITEYTVRDYSAVDAQIKEIADREKIVTQKLKLENLKKFIFLGCVILLALDFLSCSRLLLSHSLSTQPRCY